MSSRSSHITLEEDTYAMILWQLRRFVALLLRVASRDAETGHDFMSTQRYCQDAQEIIDLLGEIKNEVASVKDLEE